MATAHIRVIPPLRVGDVLGQETDDGGAAFIWELSREPGPFRVEAIGADWVVVRSTTDRNVFHGPFLFVGEPEALTIHRPLQPTN